MPSRRAKIVCTIGPATDSPDGIRRLIEAGMDVARLNFSHGSHDDHARRLAFVREQSTAVGRPVAVLQDLQGPKIRTGRGGPREASTGGELLLVPAGVSREDAVTIDYARLTTDLHAGDVVRLDDGLVVLRVTEVGAGGVRCRVEHGGPLRDRMGVNLPSVRVKLPALTEQDRRDLAFGLQAGVDYVALSFVKRADDIRDLRELCESLGRPTPIVAKIETTEAVANMWEVVAAADAVMVARGDLGVELSPERVPVIQKQIIATCRLQHTPVIVATEMLQSMVEASRPTRAEASDVAAAAFEGADALMLSAETATGKHPHAACSMMNQIIREAEASRFYAPPPSETGRKTQDAIAHSACDVARELGAQVLVAATLTGGTPRLMSKARPGVPIVAFSSDEKILRRLALYWGVVPRSLPFQTEIEALVAAVTDRLRDAGAVAPGDRFVIAYGAPLGVGAPTNALRVVEVPGPPRDGDPGTP